MPHFEKKITSEDIYKGRVIRLQVDKVELEDASQSTREVIIHPGGVAVLAIDTDDSVLMVRQFRYPMGQELLELPAGKLEFGEDPLECGKRELEEETGFCAKNYRPLTGLFPAAAYTSERIHLYLATDLMQSRQNLDAQEFLSVERIAFDKLLKMILDGEILDAKTQTAVMQYACLKNMGKL